MLFAIHCLYAKDVAERRQAVYEQHHAHFDNAAAYGVEIKIAGPLVADDGETPVGSLVVVEAPDRAKPEAFVGADPYQVHGIWEKVDVNGFLKRRG
jgi:uncharacterized protein YciI